MKVSQELKDEFIGLEETKKCHIGSLMGIFEFVKEFQDSYYSNMYSFLFGNGIDQDNKNQLLFAKWWAGEEEIEVEEELYYLKLPFSKSAYVNLDIDGDVYPGNKIDTLNYRTKFTMNEIKNNEKLQLFMHLSVPVCVEEN